jgi:hypothetical protein
MALIYKIWRFLLPIIFIFILIHFLKDITQDILKISTPLDMLGDVVENLSGFSYLGKNIYIYGFGYFSFLVEIFLLFSIPVVLRRKSLSKLEKFAIFAFIYLAIYFSVAICLDPKYRLMIFS